MKSLFRFTIQAIVLASLFCTFHSTSAQTTRVQKKQAKLDTVKKLVTNHNYVFMAQRANPLGWSTINLNYNYSVIFSKDSVDSYLPYYGRAYQAPINPSDPKESGIQFKSRDFEYTNINTKKSGWEFKIVPHDVKETRSFILNISESGYANLSVTSQNRQSISFDGYITNNLPQKKN